MATWRGNVPSRLMASAVTVVKCPSTQLQLYSSDGIRQRCIKEQATLPLAGGLNAMGAHSWLSYLKRVPNRVGSFAIALFNHVVATIL